MSSGTLQTCLGGPEACPLDAAGGKACDCATCAREICPRGFGVPPTARRRLALDARIVVLAARLAVLDGKAVAEREDRIDALFARQDALDADAARRVVEEEEARAQRIQALFWSLGEIVPTREEVNPIHWPM